MSLQLCTLKEMKIIYRIENQIYTFLRYVQNIQYLMLIRKLENKMAESAALLQYNVRVRRRDVVNENYPLCAYLHLACSNKNFASLGHSC